jgi:hypothetical protein
MTTEDRAPVNRWAARVKEHPIVSAAIVAAAVLAWVTPVYKNVEELASRLAKLLSPREFVISGDLIVEGDAEVPKGLRVRVIWISGTTTIQSPEVAIIDPTSGRMSYTVKLAKLPPERAAKTEYGARALARRNSGVSRC